MKFITDPVRVAYRNPPVSGNALNGVGETTERPARQIFHSSGARDIEWSDLEAFFLMTMPFSLLWQGLKSRWLLRKADGTIAKTRQDVSDLQAMAKTLKSFAKSLGATSVGICELQPQDYFEGQSKPYQYAISIACPQNFEAMAQHMTTATGGMDTLSTYTKTTEIVIDIAKRIRGMGWRARAYCESADILHIPIAIRAGVGELGKHGSLITREAGSEVRLATVLTDIPMALDEPVDLGVEDLCAGCQRCTIDCPVDAITDKKQMVRGVEKWYVDFDKCVPFFSETYGCGICIHVCPFSKPGRGPSLVEKLLEKRASRAAAN